MHSIQSKDSVSKLSGMVLLSMLVVSCGTQTTKTEFIATATVIAPIPLVTTSPTATLEPKTILHEGMVHLLGTNHRQLPRLRKISYGYPEAGDITITWELNDNIYQSSKKAQAQIEATNILKLLEKSETRFIYVILIGIYPLPDKNGKVSEIQAINLGFNKSKLDTINWVEFHFSEVYDLADVMTVADEWK